MHYSLPLHRSVWPPLHSLFSADRPHRCSVYNSRASLHLTVLLPSPKLLPPLGCCSCTNHFSQPTPANYSEPLSPQPGCRGTKEKYTARVEESTAPQNTSVQTTRAASTSWSSSCLSLSHLPRFLLQQDSSCCARRGLWATATPFRPAAALLLSIAFAVTPGPRESVATATATVSHAILAAPRAEASKVCARGASKTTPASHQTTAHRRGFSARNDGRQVAILPAATATATLSFCADDIYGCE